MAVFEGMDAYLIVPRKTPSFTNNSCVTNREVWRDFERWP
jgi:hypothetical protein